MDKDQGIEKRAQLLAHAPLREKKRILKSDACNILTRLYGDGLSSEAELDDIAELYRFFMKKPNPKNSDLAWVALACSNTGPYDANRYIYVKNGYAMACSGSRIHACILPCEFGKSRDNQYIDVYGNILSVKPHGLYHFDRQLEILKKDYSWSTKYFKKRHTNHDDTIGIGIFGHKCHFNATHVEDCFLDNLSISIRARTNFNGQDLVKVTVKENKFAILSPMKEKKG